MTRSSLTACTSNAHEDDHATARTVAADTTLIEDARLPCETKNAFYHQRYGLSAHGVTALRSDAVPRLYFSVTEGGFDPCSPISYSLLTGSYGDLDKPNGIAASSPQGLIVWSGPTPLANTGVTAASIDTVQVLSDDTLQAPFGRRGGATAEGITERATVQLQVQGDQLVPISETPTIIP
ncbi:hypothetical protein [Corynebacterium sp.]|uniref:hypothetical protein n=1 Tax=Corynebacterium sp. TaxID=1720 RepID=UPI0027BACA3E|nr:hypothetical protein [Corynebacterium sp.]